MPVNPTYPGLYIEELPSSAHTITPAPTSITVFVGYPHPLRGQCVTDEQNGVKTWWNEAIRIFSFADYERWFGGLFHHEIGSELAYAVMQFFINGGSDAYVVPLKPVYRDAAGGNLGPVTGATLNISGIKFTAKHLTDSANRVTVSIRNIRSVPASGGVPAHEKADVALTFGTFFEAYRDVEIYAGAPSSITNPQHIHNQLKRSSIVAIEPQNGAAYPNAYTGVAAPIDIWTMTKPAGTVGTTAVVDYDLAFQNDQPLDKVEIFNLLVTPGESNPTVWSTALAYAEKHRAFYIMDPPPNAAADATYGGLGMTPIENHVNSVPHAPPNGALYFPYLWGGDPLKPNGSVQAPSGFIAGVFAKTDQNRGVWKAPAGLETSVVNARRVVETGRMTDMRQGVLNPKGVNCLRDFGGSGTVIWGARTISTENKSLEQWRYVPVRRMALFIEQTLLRNLGWVVFEPNAAPLWKAITLSVEGFMLSLYRQQAFFGDRPSDAFRVQCDSTTTTDQDIDNGIVNIFVGFRPLKPAEFVVIKIAQLAGQVQT